MSEELELIKRDLKINRILLIVILSVLVIFFAAAIACAVFVYMTVKKYMPAIESLNAIDVEAFNNTIDMLSKLDINGINETIKTIQENMAKMQEAIDSFTGMFSGLFGGR